jgi:hypothetical protein
MIRRLVILLGAVMAIAYFPSHPWIPTLVPAAQAIEEFNAFVLPDTSVVSPGSTFDIRFEVDATAHQFNGYEVTIHCDPTIATPDTVIEGQLMLQSCPSSRFRHLSKTDSTMTYTHVILCHDVAINGPGVLSIFRFRNAQPGVSPITITSNPDFTFYDAGEYVAPTHPTRPRQVIFHHAVLIVLDPTSDVPAQGGDDGPGGGFRLRLYPNPVSGSGVLRLDLPGATAGWVEILDPQGRRIWDWAGSWGATGRFALPWKGTDLTGRPVPAGFYICRARSGDRQAASGFVLLR